MGNLPQPTDVLVHRLRRIAHYFDKCAHDAQDDPERRAQMTARANTCWQCAGRLEDLSKGADMEADNRAEDQGPSMEMPRYKCHKEVHALKIEQVIDPTQPGNESDGSRILRFEEYAYAPIRVNHDYVRKHKPEAGGYYVVYEDGYKSFSPAAPFESGYTRI